jgi:hypothetical protein|tara:strand:- start:407 stop:595 length:189 start_codon:yes stop_codon:yes gene_type:complete
MEKKKLKEVKETKRIERGGSLDKKKVMIFKFNFFLPFFVFKFASTSLQKIETAGVYSLWRVP